RGAPLLLEIFADAGVPATYFTTGDVAERYPESVRQLVAAGHELGCHGMTHRPFDSLVVDDAQWEIDRSSAILRTFADVTSFRAPYLRFPEPFVRLLEEARFTLDSSLAKYKQSYRAPRAPSSLARIPASMTSSVLRLPAFVRDPWLASLADPVVLFVHPWEFIDLTRERLRYDCRFRTGPVACRSLREVIALFARRGDTFLPMRALSG
ncbi:MAG: polysaccharide deacetylase family protein, partial [Gemmatimonadaceae bacterium]|nr:polysaccharide deacetylase family protein [Gemmatimonadaceae bacterium]